jgi:hypothetical protein
MSVDGCWIVCRMCRFPVRLPRRLLSIATLSSRARLLLACPVCGHVYKYGISNFEQVRFRTSDPFLNHRAVLYSVNFSCGTSACGKQAEIMAVGAEDISIAFLLNVWSHWTLHVGCRGGHQLKCPAVVYWEISRVSPRAHLPA